MCIIFSLLSWSYNYKLIVIFSSNDDYHRKKLKNELVFSLACNNFLSIDKELQKSIFPEFGITKVLLLVSRLHIKNGLRIRN
jgi:hypothetical protein